MTYLFRIRLLFIVLLSITNISIAQTSNAKVTILSTMVADYDYLGEWGFAALIESDGNQILFDTGFRKNTVLENADSLGIDLSKVEHVFLSHNHTDHTGGLQTLRKKLMKKNSNALKYAHVGEGMFLDRWSDGINRNKFKAQKQTLENLGIEFIYHNKSKEILPNIWTTGVVPRVYNEKNWSGYREMTINGKTVEDNVPEDHSIAITTDKGLILVSGCGHAGVVNTMKHTVETFNKSYDIYAAIGGFHLFNKNDKEMRWTAKEIKKYGVEYFVGAHCTGIDAVYKIQKLNRMSREECAVGSVSGYFDLENGMFPGRISK